MGSIWVAWAHVADRNVRIKLGFPVDSAADHNGRLGRAILGCGRAPVVIAVAT